MSFMTGMMESWSLRDRYLSWMRSLESSSDRSSKNGMTACNKCGFCCARRPCVPTPDEVKIIADYLGLGIKEMVHKYFIADDLGDGTKFIFPAKETQLDITGTFIDWRRTYDKGYCVFFNKERELCKIHEVRPRDAKTTNCWKELDDETYKQEKATRMALWDKADLTEFGIADASGDDY